MTLVFISGPVAITVRDRDSAARPPAVAPGPDYAAANRPRSSITARAFCVPHIRSICLLSLGLVETWHRLPARAAGGGPGKTRKGLTTSH